MELNFDYKPIRVSLWSNAIKRIFVYLSKKSCLLHNCAVWKHKEALHLILIHNKKTVMSYLAISLFYVNEYLHFRRWVTMMMGYTLSRQNNNEMIPSIHKKIISGKYGTTTNFKLSRHTNNTLYWIHDFLTYRFAELT